MLPLWSSETPGYQLVVRVWVWETVARFLDVRNLTTYLYLSLFVRCILLWLLHSGVSIVATPEWLSKVKSSLSKQFPQVGTIVVQLLYNLKTVLCIFPTLTLPHYRITLINSNYLLNWFKHNIWSGIFDLDQLASRSPLGRWDSIQTGGFLRLSYTKTWGPFNFLSGGTNVFTGQLLLTRCI